MLEYMLLRPAERHLAERLAEMREKLANYKRFRELTDEWVELVVELEQQERERNRYMEIDPHNLPCPGLARDA
jgi:seryl-tRNA synthetase